MEWLLLLGLAVWVVFIHRRLSRVESELREARRGEASPPSPARTVVSTPAQPPAAIAPSPTVTAEPAWTAVPRSPAPPPLPPPAPRPNVANRATATWISENGLAWLGGGTLALGGLFLVAYAAQRGLFTPALRVWAA